MPSNNVQATAIIKSFTDANRVYESANSAGKRANSIKVCNNTYLVRESHTKPAVTESGEVLKLGQLIVDSYALVFHGSKIVRYHADGTVSLNSNGYETATTKHRMNQFSPFHVSQSSGVWSVRYYVRYTDQPDRGMWVGVGEFQHGMRIDPTNGSIL